MGTNTDFGRFVEETYVSVGSAKVIPIPSGVGFVTVRLIPDVGSTGKIETSLDSPDKFFKENAPTYPNTVWSDWPAGEIGVLTEDVLLGVVSALRVSCLTGDKVRVQILGTLSDGARTFRRA